MGAGWYFGGEKSVAFGGEEKRREIIDWGFGKRKGRKVDVEETRKWSFGKNIFRIGFAISTKFDYLHQEK